METVMHIPSIAQYKAALLEQGLKWYPLQVRVQYLLEKREKQNDRIRDAESQIRRIDEIIEQIKKAG
jgi:hypothetical protein